MNARAAARTHTAARARQRTVAAGAPPALLRDRFSGLLARGGQYNGARMDRPNTRGWRTIPQSPDRDTVGDLPTLRARTRDAVRNMPLAASALLTFQTCVIGRGLVPSPMLDRDFLQLTEAQADALESQMMRHWRAWSRSKYSSFTGTMSFARQQKLALTGRIVNGDHWVVLRRRPHPTLPYSLALQHIEADLVSTPPAPPADVAIVDGVEYDTSGAPVAIWVANHYPHDLRAVGEKQWVRVPIYSNSEPRERLVWHIADPDRINQSRGVPRFAAGLEILKAKSDWVENSLTAALVGTIFTIAFKSPRGTRLLPQMVAIDPVTRQPIVQGDEVAASRAPRPPAIELGSANTVSMFADETIEKIESAHPHPNFDMFNNATAGEFCASVGLPRELVMRAFTASFSASKGAINEGWKVVHSVRSIDEQEFCEPTWRRLMSDLAADGVLDLPGFFDDPMRREAFLAVEWSGPLPGQLDSLKEAKAMQVRLSVGQTTLQKETAQYDNGSWEGNHPQSAKEKRWRVRDGLESAVETIPASTAVQDDEDDDDTTDEESA